MTNPTPSEPPPTVLAATPIAFPKLPSRKVSTSSNLRPGSDPNIIHGDDLSSRARNLHINRGGPKPTSIHKEVVILARRRLPGGAAIRRDLELSNRDVRVDDLHGEPVLRRPLFVAEAERRGDAARDDVPRHIDDAEGRVCESGERVREEVEVVGAAAGALIDNLLVSVFGFLRVRLEGRMKLTIALIEFPLGPVTSMQAPQLPALSQLESESAVPKMPEGSE